MESLASRSRVLPGDCGGDQSGSATAAGLPEQARPVPPPCSPLKSAPSRGTRFWALAGESSDEEEEFPSVVQPSPRSAPSPRVFGDFLDPAWERFAARPQRAPPAKRSAFAPGGRSSRFGQGGLGGAFV